MIENIDIDENQTYDSQVEDLATEIVDDDKTFDIIQEQNEGYKSICRE